MRLSLKPMAPFAKTWTGTASASYKTWRITPDLWSSHGMTFRIFRAYAAYGYLMIYGYFYQKKHLNHQICWSTSRCCILSHKPICWIDWYTTLYSTTLLKVVSQPYLVFQLPASHRIRFHSLHVQLMWARHVGLEGHAMVNTDDLIPGWW